MGAFDAIFRDLGLTVFERGWLSSNNILFSDPGESPALLVDSGYSSHEEQTVELVRRAVQGRGLARLVNTHLHSDHCGGNAALQAAFGCAVSVPEASLDAVRQWDADRLSYRDTGQFCPRFVADGALRVGDEVRLGAHSWRVLAAPGHDPDAVMFFEPRSRVLISGDALWKDRLAIVFPEFHGGEGFDAAARALDTIAALQPAIVIPGHGPAFADVASALAISRQRLVRFAADPRRHLRYGARALTMFHMLEHRQRCRGDLIAWLSATPIFVRISARASDDRIVDHDAFATQLIDGLLRDGLLVQRGNDLIVVSD